MSNSTRSDTKSDDSNPASSVSPTPTVRDSRNLSPVDPRAHIPAPIHTDHQAQHLDLGMGHPEAGPLFTTSSTSPPTTGMSSRTPERSTHRLQIPDDLASPSARRSGSPSISRSNDAQTPRVSESLRGIPRSAVTGTFGSGSPYTNTNSSGGSAARPRNMVRNHSTTAYPVSHPVNPAYSTYQNSQIGSMSRSASRSRPALKDVVALPSARQIEEDDETEVVDRGADLIRKRQRERKEARKKKERERRKVEDGVTPDVSAPPTGQAGESLSAQQARVPVGRSTSRSRLSSGVHTERTGSESYFGTSWSSSITPQGPLSPRDDFRPPSTYASTVDQDDDDDDEESRRAESIVDEVVHSVIEAEAREDEDEQDGSESGENEDEDDEGVTLKDRQDAINIEHPFGLPIWKPALYRKSRTVTRNADSALHAIPSAAAERHLLPGNIVWILLFGWWLAITCFVVALLVSAAEVLGGGRGGYGKTLRGLAWYIGWPFGKYIEGEGAPDDDDDEAAEEDGDDHVNDYGATDGSPTARPHHRQREPSDGASSGITVRDTRRIVSGASAQREEPPSPTSVRPSRPAAISFAPTPTEVRHEETEPLVRKSPGFRRPRNKRAKLLGRIVYWPCFLFIVAPIMLSVCVICWGLVLTIPMAKLTWLLLTLLYTRPLEINFRSAPQVSVPNSQSPPSGSPGSGDGSGDTTAAEDSSPNGYTMRRARLKAGQLAPTAGPRSTVLLCTYRAMGLQYLKYTVGGVNIIFVNLLPLILFVIIDDFFLLPAVEKMIERGHPPSPFVQLVTSQGLIFFLSLASVIPLSYFIGMAVASISAQSSIGMGAVINATFGSIIEIILYSIALMEGKGRLVEGSIVGSILAGVLLMPGVSMLSGALKRKEQRFNAKSAGVTSTMLIMATIGTLTPTMFYQIYGSLRCEGCPDMPGGPGPDTAWKCTQCYYEHPDPVNDPFYQDQIKTLMYLCAAILLLSYLIGLWFSLRTHAAQIWQNPQQLMKAEEAIHGPMHPAHRASLTQRITPQAMMQHILPLHKGQARDATPPSRQQSMPTSPRATTASRVLNPDVTPQRSQSQTREASAAEEGTVRGPKHDRLLPSGYTPFLESVDRNIKTSPMGPMKLPSHLTTDDFTRAVAAATVSALRHQGSTISQAASGHKPRVANISSGTEEHEGQEGGGHESPNWTRGVSAGVLLGCTVLFAMIAEILVDVVDVVLEGVNIDEKFLGLTLFTLIPNTTEFMNAMSFAMNGNIALSMEIGSAYALQVCLLQIPAMVAFSALYDPKRMGEDVDTFNLIFPQWDVIAIILAIFLLTYTYIEARSNYHRGSTLVLSYLVLVMGFYFAPNRGQGDIDVILPGDDIRPTITRALTRLWA